MPNLPRIKRKPIKCFETFAFNENKNLMRFESHHSTHTSFYICKFPSHILQQELQDKNF